MSQFNLNGHTTRVSDQSLSLHKYLRLHHLTGTKAPCEEGDCGSCQVLVFYLDKSTRIIRGQAETSCLLRLGDLDNRSVFTIEALSQTEITIQPNPLLSLAAETPVSQCGFCSPGLIIGLCDWLLNGDNLSEEEGQQWLNGNLCRCTGYMAQKRAIQQIAFELGPLLLSHVDRLEALIELNILPRPQFPECTDIEYYLTPEKSESPQLYAGGTDLAVINNFKSETSPRSHQTSINIFKPFDKPCTQEKKEIILNATVPINQLTKALTDQLPPSSHFLTAYLKMQSLFASHPIRNRATLGGNLAHGSPTADTAVWLLCFSPTVNTNQRQFHLDEFYQGYKLNILADDEIIESISIPHPNILTTIKFDKVCRRPHTDIAAVNFASNWECFEGTLKTVRLAIGGAREIPIRLKQTEAFITSKALDYLLSDGFISLNETLQREIKPISDSRGSETYRRLLARQLLFTHLKSCLDSEYDKERTHA